MYSLCVHRSVKKGWKVRRQTKPYIYVGNDDESNGYLLYNRTKHETITQGIVQFVGNVDVYGNVLSNYDQTFVYNCVYKTNVPANYTDVVDYNDKCGTIHDIDVYYDNRHQQTYGLVQFKRDIQVVWVQAEALFQSKFYRSDNMRQLLRYLKNQAKETK